MGKTIKYRVEEIKEPENFDNAKVEYVRASVKYKKWSFFISQKNYSTQPEWEFDINVYCELFGDRESFLLMKPRKAPYTASPTIKTMDEAMELVKNFINNEIQ